MIMAGNPETYRRRQLRLRHRRRGVASRGCDDARHLARLLPGQCLIGHFQTSTGIWPLMDIRSQIMSRFASWDRMDPARAEWSRDLKASPSSPTRLPGGIAYYESARHGLEVEHDTYRRELRKLVRRFDKVASAARPSRQSSLPVVR
jgi:hypothetical protein